MANSIGQVGLPPIQVQPLGYAGSTLNYTPVVYASRAPTVNDVNYPTSCEWVDSTNQDIWLLHGFLSGSANWKIIGTGSSPGGTVVSLSDTANTQVSPDVTGNIQLTAGTGVSIISTPASNLLTISLTGGGIAVDQIAVQAATAPGVTPVDPTGAGLLTINGAAVAAHSVPIETRSRALNALNVELQRSTASAVTDATAQGISSFNSAQFSADANGWISLVGGSGPAAQKFNVDANTGPGTDPVIPDGSGQVIVTGGQVAAGTVGTNVIRTDSLAANTYTIEIQRSTAVAATDSTNNGVSHFDSADFSVDANGFVSLNGSGITLWQTTSVNVANMSVNRGYICIAPGGALTLGLPAASALGDELEITLDGATSFQITQAAGQQIRIGNQQTTAGAAGTLTTTAAGDTLRLVCQTANLKWNVLSTMGNFVVA